MQFETHIIETEEQFEALRQYVVSEKFEYVVIDTETDSVIEKTAKIFGIGLCFEDEQAFYIPIRKNNEEKESWWTSELEKDIYAWVFEICKKHKTLGWNLIYDTLVFENNSGYDISPYIYSDGILQKHLLSEERPFGLKEVAVEYLGAWADKAQKEMYDSIKANGGTTTKTNLEMWRCDTTILGVYCCWDVILTRKLFDLFEPRLKAEGLYDLFYTDEIMPLYKEVTIPMKRQGFAVDVPYFKQLNEDISEEIVRMEQKVQEALKPDVADFVTTQLETEYPVKRSGNFPKYAAQVLGFALPLNKDGNVTLSKKELDRLPEPSTDDHRGFLSWLKGSQEQLDEALVERIRHFCHLQDNNSPYVFNLRSNNHLKWLFFEHLGEKPLNKTDGGEPQVDEDFMDSVATQYEWAQLLIDYKKLMKLKSTYIEGILERQIDGVLYASFLMFGTTSGRFSCTGPNLQNIPRVKEDDSGISELVLKYANGIKRGLIAPEGHLLINSDYSQLEPRAFAEACGDPLLQKVFIDGEDLYGAIAVNIWDLDCTANEVKKKYNEKRQQAKIIALACVYGAEAGRISKLMNIEYVEAQKIIDDYLDAYQGLKDYMSNCEDEVCTKGYIKTKFGRIRHLPLAKVFYEKYGMRLINKKWAMNNGLEEVRWKFKNMLNLAKNFPIQGVGASVVNRAMITTMRQFKKEGIKACIIANVHDELCCVALEKDADRVKAILRECMENTTKLSVPLKAEPLIAKSWDEAK